MNYILELNAFSKWRKTNHLPNLAQLLWRNLMELYNEARWPEWQDISNAQLMTLINTTEKTAITMRNHLVEAGLLIFEPGIKGKPSRYKLIPPTTFTVIFPGNSTGNQPVDSLKYPVKITAHTHAQTAACRDSCQSTPALSTPVTVESLEVETPPPRVGARAVFSLTPHTPNNLPQRIDRARDPLELPEPPTLDEVFEYCREREYTFDPERFYNFYASRGWKRKGDPVVNWRAAVDYWNSGEYHLTTLRVAERRAVAAKYRESDVDYDEYAGWYVPRGQPRH